ncbi:hypothetical protein APUTEX25_000883, partial [Auxenochlorella protothecoides]
TKLELAWRNRERSLEAVRARAARSKHRAAAASERMARQRAALVLRLERKAAAGARVAGGARGVGAAPRGIGPAAPVSGSSKAGPQPRPIQGVVHAPESSLPAAEPTRPHGDERPAPSPAPSPAPAAEQPDPPSPVEAAAAFLRLDLPVIVSPSPSPSLAPGSTALAAAVHVAASSDAPLAAVSARFDRLTAALGSPATLRATGALLGAVRARHPGPLPPLGHLLRRVFPPSAARVPRYPARVVLSAYAVATHPEVVLSGLGGQEAGLVHAGARLAAALRAVALAWVEGGEALDGDAASRTATQDPTPTAALPAFDAAWVEYLELFVAWKAADAAALEADLIRIAVELQASAARKREESAARDVRARSAPDMAALEAALQADLALLRERVLQLTGRAGLRRLEAALRATPGEGEAVGGAPGLDGAEGQGRGTTSQPAAAAEEGGEGGVAQTIDAWDVDAFLAQHPNFRLLWQLLHKPTWRLPTEEAEGAWRGAVRAETGPDMASSPVVDAGSGRVDAARLRTIAEAAFWDGLRHDLNKADTAGTAGKTARRGVLQRVHAILSEQAAELLDALDPASSLIEVVGAHLSTDKLRTLLGESHATPLHQPLLGLLRWSIQLLPKELHPEAERACASLAGSASESAEPTGTAAPPPTSPLTWRCTRCARSGGPAPAPGSWRGLLRIGAVQLAAGEGAVARLAAPEVAVPDRGRLVAAQEAFQQTLVLNACLLLLRTVARGGDRVAPLADVAADPDDAAADPGDAAADPNDTATNTSAPAPLTNDAKRRLLATLRDPGSNPADIAALVQRLGGGAPDARAEAALLAGLRRLVARNGPALRVLTQGLSQALMLTLLGGGGAARRTLVRCGAAELEPEVRQLAAQLEAVCGVTEAAFGPWLAALAEEA